jgi:hypothetical protein
VESREERDFKGHGRGSTRSLSAGWHAQYTRKEDVQLLIC